MRIRLLLLGVCLGLAVGGCASQGGHSDASQAAAGSPVKRSEGAVATPEIPADSPLAKIQPGMSEGRVYDILGQPTETKTYLTGKQWIPFYFGPDVHRKEAYFKGLGRIVFVPSGAMGTGVYKVHQVIYDPTEDGYAD
ncbi:hypothetical protein MIN45_P2250 [Methylomarinovum tepidoasis]|uniref:Lipoprotein SmpA/OmlA domain-containing protein n=1 Tax=Methylomarinovum tepidoasis TaxID=2840183 RepID=A0AAU9CD81_9GAMM|nr:hypothetical protein [Methylomarinovum sp. IN45]BCX89876.1 hypothetical protein MIN45_P2250 [Methylomarinovum sp. IN45]